MCDLSTSFASDGNGRSAFPGDIAKFGLGTDRTHVGLAPETIELDDAQARALLQILRLTYMNAMTPISDLRQALMADFPEILERR